VGFKTLLEGLVLAYNLLFGTIWILIFYYIGGFCFLGGYCTAFVLVNVLIPFLIMASSFILLYLKWKHNENKTYEYLFWIVGLFGFIILLIIQIAILSYVFPYKFYHR
jgi:hypothetical protein